MNLNQKLITVLNKQYPVRICKYSKGINPSNEENNLLVKNISKDITSREFFDIFRAYGDIKSCKLEYTESLVSKGYGYITYYSSSDMEKAISSLQNKEIKGLNLDLSLMTGNVLKDGKNVIFIKNLPFNFTNEDLKLAFLKYGDIISVSFKGEKVRNSGTGVVAFQDHRSAAAAISDSKLKPISFSGMPFLEICYFTRKEDRIKQLNNQSKGYKGNQNPVVLFAKLYDESLINDIEMFNSNLKLFIKIVMVSEYVPFNIIPNIERKSAFVFFKSSKDAELFMLNYRTKMVNPEFFFDYLPDNYTSPTTIPDTSQLIGGMQNLSIKNTNINTMSYNNNFNYKVPPQNHNQNQLKQNQPFKHINQIPKQQPRYNNYEKPQQQVSNLLIGNQTQSINYDKLTEDEAANEIYEIVFSYHPNFADKITGMIIDLGLSEMKECLKNRNKLYDIVSQAYKVSIYFNIYIYV